MTNLTEGNVNKKWNLLKPGIGVEQSGHHNERQEGFSIPNVRRIQDK